MSHPSGLGMDGTAIVRRSQLRQTASSRSCAPFLWRPRESKALCMSQSSIANIPTPLRSHGAVKDVIEPVPGVNTCMHPANARYAMQCNALRVWQRIPVHAMHVFALAPKPMRIHCGQCQSTGTQISYQHLPAVKPTFPHSRAGYVRRMFQGFTSRQRSVGQSAERSCE